MWWGRPWFRHRHGLRQRCASLPSAGAGALNAAHPESGGVHCGGPCHSGQAERADGSSPAGRCRSVAITGGSRPAAGEEINCPGGDWLSLPGRADIEKIPVGRCWVEGDNLKASRDSFTAYGCIPIALIEGRVTNIIWPPTRWGRVPCEPPPARVLLNNAGALSDNWRASRHDW
eukprot:jgi/Botrbrau1/18097/Bobra.0738s0002.1